MIEQGGSDDVLFLATHGSNFSVDDCSGLKTEYLLESQHELDVNKQVSVVQVLLDYVRNQHAAAHRQRGL